ncbi:response regulator [Vibrio sp. CAU 1672]|uniref:response regulator n=1 Tax=Vibrio sp. CAU 1672 TaxID=3032594 RepID=UPI0023DA916E|nr:response regulator [Vibrio sp. CAU 1672]MDF2152230.1 response regulator [Vibrio sp. CAU 1672]
MKRLIWHDWSVRYKLFSLVCTPILLLLFLAGQQVATLSNQASDVEKAKLYSQYLDTASLLYELPYTADSANATRRILIDSQNLKADAQYIFSDQTPEILALLDSFEEASLALLQLTDPEEKRDLAEWNSDIYSKILLAMEKVPFEHTTVEIKNHLSALIQMEWLMFWSNEEYRLSKVLIEENKQQTSEEHAEIISEISALISRQELFLQRFVTLTANQNQVGLFIESFSDEVFALSQDFRSLLLNHSAQRENSSSELKAGLQTLNERLQRLKAVDAEIEKQLEADIANAISVAKQQQLLFISIVTITTFGLISLALALARKVTNNLNLVLNYLKYDDITQAPSLATLIRGHDELSQFAREVKDLSEERAQAKLNLTLAKEDAEKAKDQAIRASKAKSSFLANMSHEIRTPLNGVIGISEILADTSLSATQRDYVDTIETSSQLLLSLINDILDFSKIESGMLHISPHSTNIRESLYDIASVVSPRAKEKRIDLAVSINHETPYRLLLDDHRIRQVIMNFMSNAIKFTNSGSVHLAVSTRLISDQQATVEFSVSDSGIGIDAEQQKYIFEPFTQEDSSTTRQFGGTGLGLAISNQLIELMGGKIELESEKNCGSRFSFTLTCPIQQLNYNAIEFTHGMQIWLVCDNRTMAEQISNELDFYHIPINKTYHNLEAIPREVIVGQPVVVIYMESKPDTAAQHHSLLKQLTAKHIHFCLIKHLHSVQFDFGHNVTAVVTQPLLGQRLLKAINKCTDSFNLNEQVVPLNVAVNNQPRLLIVEDNTINQKIAALHVAKAGYTYDIAANGAEAVDMFRTQRYSLILMDCMMPVMDGFEATRRIRQLENEENRPYRTPIIALTASIVDDDITKCFDSGMDDYIPKPFTANVLKDKLTKAIDVLPHPGCEASPHFVEPLPVATPLHLAINDKPNHIVTSTVKVLLVEDNLVNQKVASLLLDKAGYQYEIAENGQIAVEMYQQDHDFDIILMDCMMPVKDGFTAAREIRAYEKSNRLDKTPIIALTASVIDDDIQRCFDSGMDAYVPKPVRKEKLLHQIKNVT